MNKNNKIYYIVLIVVIALLAILIGIKLVIKIYKDSIPTEFEQTSADSFTSDIEYYILFSKNEEIYGNDGTFDIKMPIPIDNVNISCTLKDGIWENTKNYNYIEESSSCEEFMNAVKKYSSVLDSDLPDSCEIIISSDGLVQAGSKLKYGNIECVYNFETKDNINIGTYNCKSR